MKEQSEFGRGFIYNLVLFSKHWWRHFNDLKISEEMREKNPDLFSEEDALSMWFNGAGDHFYDFEVPDTLRGTSIGKLAKSLQKRALHYRMNDVTKVEFDKFFEDLEKLCRDIDKKVFKVKSEKAKYN